MPERWGAFTSGVVQAARALPGALQVPNPVEGRASPVEVAQNVFDDAVNAGFEQFREYLRGPIEVSEELELASGLPAFRNRVNGQPGIDGAGDALKHVTHAALIQFVAPRIAPSLLQGKEHIQGGAAAVMDRHNNEVGFRIGREALDAVRDGRITREQAPAFIIDRVIQEFEAAQNVGANGDFGGDGPYWLRNHGFARLDHAAPGWQQRSRDTIVNNSERALQTNFPWD